MNDGTGNEVPDWAVLADTRQPQRDAVCCDGRLGDLQKRLHLAQERA